MSRDRGGIWLLMLAILTVWTAGCGRYPATTRPPDGVIRMIEEEPSELFAPEQLYAFEEEFAFTLGGEGAGPEWKVWGATVLRGGTGEVGFATTRARPALSFEVDIEADSMDALELVHRGERHGEVWLRWATEPGTLEPEAMLLGESSPHDNEKVVFRLLGHPAWHGRIRQLAVTVWMGRDRRFRIERIAGLRRTVDSDDEVFREALGRAWKVEIDDEWRNALIADRDEPASWKIEVPQDACLEFGYGSTGERIGDVSYAVRAVVDGGGLEELFQASVDWHGAEAEWRDASVDLGAFAGEWIELLFEARAADESAKRYDYAVWSDPRIAACERQSERLNLLLVSLDTLRADRLSAYGHTRETSPNLDAWAATSAVLFRKTVAAAAWTLPSHTSMFTGLHVHRHGVNQYTRIPLGVTTLAEYLREQGYATAAITGGGLTNPGFNFAQGFDSYLYSNSSRAKELSDGLDTAVRWLEDQPARPWFLFFHTYETHTPYNVRQPFFDRFSRFEGMRVKETRVEGPKAELGFENVRSMDRFRARGPGAEELDRSEVVELVNDIYDSSVAYLDQELTRLFEALDLAGLSDRTVVIVTSDHGELLGEHDGRSGHSFLYEENLLVPLMIAAPGQTAAGRVVERQVGTVDVTPTALDLLGLEPHEGLDGVSLAPLVRGEEIAGPSEIWSHAGRTNRGISLRIDDRWKYVFNHSVWRPLPARAELVDLGGAESVSPTPEALRRRVEETLRQGAAGLRIRLRNGTSRALGGEIRGPMLGIYETKSWDVRSGEVWWSGNERVSYRLDPGREFHLLIEGGGAGPTEVEIGPVAAAADKLAELAFEIVQPGRVSGYLLESDGWAPTASLDGETGIWVWWQGEFPPSGPAPTETDTELQEDLRALGYID